MPCLFLQKMEKSQNSPTLAPTSSQKHSTLHHQPPTRCPKQSQCPNQTSKERLPSQTPFPQQVPVTICRNPLPLPLNSLFLTIKRVISASSIRQTRIACVFPLSRLFCTSPTPKSSGFCFPREEELDERWRNRLKRHADVFLFFFEQVKQRSHVQSSHLKVRYLELFPSFPRCCTEMRRR
jgi:hypothetical protein